MAYADAVNRHDDAAAYALMSPARARVVRAEVDGLPNIVSMSNLTIGDPIISSPSGGAPRGYQQAVFVPVTFILQQREPLSRSDGPTVWGYLLARISSSQPWLIVAEGPD